ncbi:MAG TPA: DUF192 domain-containing protein [Tissierellaceae bacterium]
MQIEIATSFVRRLRGLMFQKDVKTNYGLLFPNSNRVHSCFMLDEITVVYLDENFNVLDLEILKPWKLGKKVKNTKHVLEMNKVEYENILDKKKVSIKWRDR